MTDTGIRTRLEAELERRTVNAAEQVTCTGDRGDRAKAHHDAQIADREAAAVNRERLQIRAALMRLDRGTYGLCAGCGGAIPPKRLDAIPWAALCVGCQQHWDELDIGEDAA